MAFRDFSGTQQSLQLLQRSLERGRVAHGYLFSGSDLDYLETIGRTLAKTLNCEKPIRKNDRPVDCCDQCAVCRKIEELAHPDVHGVRPESKSRIITVDQMRELMRQIQLKPKEARTKVAIVVAADRLRVEGANAFLKTLEEPPVDSVLLLLTTDPQRVLETLVSRCSRLSFGDATSRALEPGQRDWLQIFTGLAGAQQKSLISRYRLLDSLLQKLGALRSLIEEQLAARSPLNQHPDAEKALLERWEDELTAAVEAEYRRQRADLLSLVQWWLRDVWLRTIAVDSSAGAGAGDRLVSFPDLDATRQVAGRVSPGQALENLQIVDQLQRRLGGNVQEALALEVALLKLHL